MHGAGTTVRLEGGRCDPPRMPRVAEHPMDLATLIGLLSGLAVVLIAIFLGGES